MLRYKDSHSVYATKQLHSVPERARGRLAGHSSPPLPPSPQLTLISCLSFVLRQVALTPACLLARSHKAVAPGLINLILASPRLARTLDAGLPSAQFPSLAKTLPRARAIHESHLHLVCALSLVFAFLLCSIGAFAHRREQQRTSNSIQDKTSQDKTNPKLPVLLLSRFFLRP